MRHSVRIFVAALAGVALAALAVAALGQPGAGDSNAPPRAGFAPDPPSQPSRKQWIVDVIYSDGQARIASARSVTLEKPIGTARVFGRFAIELYIGKELLDRARFDVPLTGDDPTSRHPARDGSPNRRPFARPSFDDVTAHVRVQMADNPRATYALFVDRMTGTSQRLDWPPGAIRRDGGAPDAAVLDARAAIPDAGQLPGDANRE